MEQGWADRRAIGRGAGRDSPMTGGGGHMMGGCRTAPGAVLS